MIFNYEDNAFYKLYYHLKERENTMAKKKRKVRKGNFIARLQRSPKVRSIKSKIRKHKATGKRLSSQYRKALKVAARKLR